MAERSLANSDLSSERTSVRASTAAVCVFDERCQLKFIERVIGTFEKYLLMDDDAESGLAFYDCVWDTHLSA